MPPSSSRRCSSEVRLAKGKFGKGKNLSKEDVELMRARGEVSCAECRRLKLRCDKNIPCSSCIRRGCQTICPNGVLTSGQGSRFILADTDELHGKVTNMSNRIRQLEDALANAQATISREPHPMLRPELLEIKHSLSSSTSDPFETPADRSDELDKSILRSFGDLALDTGGEALPMPIVDKDESTHTKDSAFIVPSSPVLPVQIKYLSSGFPYTPAFLPKEEIQGLVEARLPTYERATSLVELYTQHASWWVRPITREQLVEELIPAAYNQRRGRTSDRSSTHAAKTSAGMRERIDPHDLAVLLMAFACGAAGDFTLEPNSDEPDIYFHLARAALSLRPVLDSPSVAAVQAICLMGSFDLVSLRKRSLEPAYKAVGFAMGLGISLGLHRDPTHWTFESKTIQRRRELFWELRYIDAWKSIATRRPVGVHPDDVDCELPIDSDATLNENGEEVPSFWHWKRLYLRDVFLPIVHKLTSVKPMKYSEILELDAKVREFGPRSLARQIANSIRREGYSGTDGVRAYLQKYLLSMLKDMSLQLLHRNFFARALFENSTNPMQSTFAPSFLSCYNSAISLLRVVREHFNIIPHVMVRYWSTWIHALISAIILGSVAVRAPSLELAPRAYVDLVLSIDTFIKARSHPAILLTLPAILKLRERAHRALLEAGRNPDKLVQELGSVSRNAEGISQATQKQNSLHERGDSQNVDLDAASSASATTTSAADTGTQGSNGLREDGGALLGGHQNSSEMTTSGSVFPSSSKSPDDGFAYGPPNNLLTGLVEGMPNLHASSHHQTPISSDFVHNSVWGSEYTPDIHSLLRNTPNTTSAFGSFSHISPDTPLSQHQREVPASASSTTGFHYQAEQAESPHVDNLVQNSLNWGVGSSSETGRTGLGRSSLNDVQEPDFATLLSMYLDGTGPPDQSFGERTTAMVPGSGTNMDWTNMYSDLNVGFELGNTTSGGLGQERTAGTNFSQMQERASEPVMGYTNIPSGDANAGSHGEQFSSGQMQVDMMLRMLPC